MSCADVEVLLCELPLGTLSDEELTLVTTHTESCTPCREKRDALEGAYDGLHEVLAVEAPAPEKRDLLERAASPRCSSCQAPVGEDEAALVGKARTPFHADCFVKSRATKTETTATAATAKALRLSISCTFCHDRLTRDEAVFCASCLAPHHGECFQEHARCAATGCEGKEIVAPQGAKPARPRRFRFGFLAVGLAVTTGAAALGVAAVRGDLRSRAERDRSSRIEEMLYAAMSAARYQKYDTGADQYRLVLALDPGNGEALRGLEECQRRIAASMPGQPPAPSEPQVSQRDNDAPILKVPTLVQPVHEPPTLGASAKPGRVELLWFPSSRNEHVVVKGYKIFRSDAPLADTLRFSMIAEVPGDTTRFIDADVNELAPYSYYVEEVAFEDAESPAVICSRAKLAADRQTLQSPLVALRTIAASSLLVTLDTALPPEQASMSSQKIATKGEVFVRSWSFDKKQKKLVAKSLHLHVGDKVEGAEILGVRVEDRDVTVAGQPSRRKVALVKLRWPDGREEELVEKNFPEEVKPAPFAPTATRAMPALLGKSYEEVISALGEPLEEEVVAGGFRRIHYRKPTAAVTFGKDDKVGHVVLYGGWTLAEGVSVGMSTQKVLDELGPPERSQNGTSGPAYLYPRRFMAIAFEGPSGTASRIVIMDKPWTSTDVNGNVWLPETPESR